MPPSTRPLWLLLPTESAGWTQPLLAPTPPNGRAPFACKYRVLVDIVSLADAPSAQRAMKLYLDRFETDIAVVTKKLDQKIGQVAVQTEGSVFWVRDAMWVRVVGVPLLKGKRVLSSAGKSFSYGGSGSGNPTSTPQTTVPSTRAGFSYSGGSSNPSQTSNPLAGRETPSTSRPVPILPTLVELATKLDVHLQKYAVQPLEQRKPNLALAGDSKSLKIPWGKTMAVKLADASGTHALKPAYPADGTVASPTQNGSASGEYTIMGKMPGLTTVSLVVVRADNLAVGTVDLQVEVVRE
ncbi:hypothetical protein QBC33DRAFT_623429 [Phialemonium atrogriseum]|uniref:Uncharacterized protein n=1 Tax=Phialemonium atrogriseum TaxID=1093897 RepID=A0AAJ0BTK8_9PEZI|nr:uncharacterized protein QBC33DRAFT_623429 [Phialemonium atrogriseum]KAK1762874.1 hypothetical protein QBC33DRAFT_623429 [Phialemonium atrogriseum]